MAVWETEDEGEETALPRSRSRSLRRKGSFKTPSRKGSKASGRSITPPASSSSARPSRPSIDRSERGGSRRQSKGSERGSRRQSQDPTIDDSISVLDPRRFTPTLHASLVSEILSLRRDQEEKLALIESLETTLDTTRAEHEALQESSKELIKENRSLKRQLSLLEGGTSSALGDLARERDEAVDGVTEVKKKLDAAQKKIRAQEEDSQRVHDLWAQEKDGWEEDRRRYEHRLHVSESRLKTILEEIAAYHEAQEAFRDGLSDGDDTTKDDGASMRTMSIPNSMTNSMRFSLSSSPKKLGKSLADELNFDPYDDTETDPDVRSSMFSGRHCRTFSRDSMLFRMHNRTVSIDSMKRPGSLGRGRLLAMNPTVLEALEGTLHREDITPPRSPPKSPTKFTPRRVYQDAAVQYSPPPSPKLAAAKLPVIEEPVTEPATVDEKSTLEDATAAASEVEANQGKKRMRLSGPLTITPPASYVGMVSAAAQTVEVEPLSPPKTPPSPCDDELTRSRPQTPPAPTMTTASTQTEPSPPPSPVSEAAIVVPLPLPVPVIAIHAPTSRPNSPGVSRLPPLTKDVGVQVSLPAPHSVDAGMQTGEILTERRLALLPAHLQPSSINSRPGSPAVLGDPSPVPPPPPTTAVSPEPASPVMEEDAEEDDITMRFTPFPGNLPPRNPRRLEGKDRRPSVQSIKSVPSTKDAYPGNNDNGPLSDEQAPVRRPHRFSSLFAGFDGSSDEGEDFAADPADLSDGEFHTALSAPKPKTSQQLMSETIMIRPGPARVSRFVGSDRAGLAPLGNPAVMLTRKNSVRRDSRPSFERAPDALRRSALIQSGVATHQSRPRSPSLPEATDPPFPIPTRASSKVPPTGDAAENNDVPTTPTLPPEIWSRRAARYRSNSIVRRTRPTVVMLRNPRYRRRGSHSPPPPPLSPSTEAPETPSIATRRQSVLATPRTDRSMATNRDSINGGGRFYKTQRARASVSSRGSNALVTLPQQQAVGVVDSIAQTMVGEWMYKYVRRRKSFGVSDGAGKDDSGNDRHKRWVWLAPYERAVLWSSKQPTSGGALLGKPGRKLIIQSVLDVKDDNPAPKGVTGLFNRSILILTSERALKFTATSSERHYLWLTALSFLAHSSQSVAEMAALAVPVPEPQHEPPPPQPLKRRGGIRDSIRLAKNKATPRKGEVVAPSVPVIPELFVCQQGPEGGASDGGLLSSPPLGESKKMKNGDMFTPLTAGRASGTARGPSEDGAADGPMIPRFGGRAHGAPVHGHGRRRSITDKAPAPPPPPLSFRLPASMQAGPGSISTGSNMSSHRRNPTNSTAGDVSVFTGGSSDMYGSALSGSHPWSASASGAPGGMFGTEQSVASSRPSEASSRPSSRMLFEAIGTMRMEAFISPLAPDYGDGYGGSVTADELDNRARLRSKELRRQRTRSKGRLSVEYARGGSFNPFGGGGGHDFFTNHHNNRNHHNKHNNNSNNHDVFGVPSGRGSAMGMSAMSEEDDFFSRQDPFKGF